MPPIIMRRGRIDLSTRTPLSIARLSASAPSSHDLSLAAFTISMAESSFRYTQGAPLVAGYVERIERGQHEPCTLHGSRRQLLDWQHYSRRTRCCHPRRLKRAFLRKVGSGLGEMKGTVSKD